MKFIKFFSVCFLGFSSLFSAAQLTEEWESQYNGPGDYSDKFNCVITDANGNIYAGGATMNPGQNSDYLIVKTSSTGSLLWRKVFNAPGNGPDEVKAITIDSSGKVYVTGFGNNVNVGNDYWTMVMNGTSGDTLWTRLYNDTQYNQYDQASSIAVDNNGNVFVTGASDRDVTGVINDDFLTVKYSATGTVLWAQRFNDIGDTNDKAVKVLTDSNGNSYITGRSNNGGDDDYATFKYNSAGVQQWVQFYDGGGTDRATDMGMDSAGNIYVTGRANNGTNDDYYTIKYSPAGGVLLSAQFDFVDDDRAEAIAVNADGSFVVTGRSDANPTPLINLNYNTVKFNTSGLQVWATSYNGTANNDDWATDVAMDSNGNVAVTGFSDSDASINVSNNIVTILYSSNGVAAWTKVYGIAGKEDSGAAVTFNSDNNIVVAGLASYTVQGVNAAILMYTSNGTETVFNDNGMGDNTENIRDLYVDLNDNVYVCGYSVNLGADRDMMTVKMNSTGDTLWTRRVSGTMFGSDEEANAIAVDNAGNVVVSGYTKNSTSGSDITIVKYSSTGMQQWIAIWDGLMNESDRAYDMEMDATGNIYITGRTDLDPLYTSNDECYTAKYSTNGLLLWSVTHAGQGVGSDRGKFIHISSSGNVYVVGRQNNGLNDDVLIIKYNNTGAQQWAITNDSGVGNDEPTDFYLDANENLFICGYKEAGLGSGIQDIITMKYNSAGVLQWQESYNGAAGGPDIAVGITLDASSNVYVTGSSNQSLGEPIQYDAITLKYNSSGVQQWIHAYTGSAGLDDISDDIAVDNAGNVFVTCHSNSGNALQINYDIVTYSLNANGNEMMNVVYNQSDSSDVANVMFLKGAELFLGGSTWLQNEQRNMLTLKYSYTIGLNEINNESQFLVYPNPCIDQLHFTLSGDYSAGGIMTITDLAGRIVKQERIGALGNMFISTSELSPGIYTISIGNQKTNHTTTFVKGF